MNGKNFTKLLKVLGVVLLTSAICNLASVYAGVPKLISFEGKLTEKDGTPISGSKTVTFRIYDSVDAAIPIWVETRNVILENGFYNICDGTNETPDLRDRFILGVASSSENPGATGGSHSVTLTTANLPVHTHSGTTDTSGAHRHNVEVRSSGEAGTRVMSTYSGWPLSGYQETESAGAHTHSFTTGSTGSGTAFDNRPAYYKLAYIMKL